MIEIPTYQGRSLDSWLKDLGGIPCGPGFKPAADAIRAIGAPAIPYLLQRIARGNTGLRDMIDRSHAGLAAQALFELGPLAMSAVPELTAIYRSHPTNFAAASALVRLSAEGPVIEALLSPTQGFATKR